MSNLKLILGNKNYSSWSMRPWIAMRNYGIDFEEQVAPFDFLTGNTHLREFSPTGKVPVLVHDELTVWDSYAILEYLADIFPDTRLWPEQRTARARARSVSSEMHSGFAALRGECPMNIRRSPRAIEISDDCRTDIKRIETLMQDCYDESAGPFLFGDFTIADAMYAPVVNRVRTYELTRHPAVMRFCEAIEGLPAWRQWASESVGEPWTVELMER